MRSKLEDNSCVLLGVVPEVSLTFCGEAEHPHRQ